jgi:hypothetical protein
VRNVALQSPVIASVMVIPIILLVVAVRDLALVPALVALTMPHVTGCRAAVNDIALI